MVRHSIYFAWEQKTLLEFNNTFICWKKPITAGERITELNRTYLRTDYISKSTAKYNIIIINVL